MTCLVSVNRHFALVFSRCFLTLMGHILPPTNKPQALISLGLEKAAAKKNGFIFTLLLVFFTLEAWYMIFFQAAKNKLAQNLSKKMKFANFNIRLLFSSNHTVKKKKTFLFGVNIHSD